MLDELLRGLREAASRPIARQLTYDLEDLLTPLEIQQALPLLSALEGHGGYAINTSPSIEMLRRETAERYVSQPVAPGVNLYRGRDGASGRGLVVVLSGRHSRPMLPVSIFLQHLPANLFDILLLYDATNSHYTEGVAGFADSLLSLTQKVHADFASGGYERVYHYGVSSGAFPALRMGLIAPAHRSIAISGLFQWPINRLQSGETVSSFDPICHCNANGRGLLACVHSTLERDVVHARRVARTVKARNVTVGKASSHNLLFPLFVGGQLRDFNQKLLGYALGRDGDGRFVEGFGV